MAKIYEEAIVIKLSKLVKDNGSIEVIANDEVVQALEAVAQELVGTGIIVEVEKA